MGYELFFEIQKAKHNILAVKSIPRKQREIEARLNRRLGGIFGEVLDTVLREFERRGRVPSDEATRRAIIARMFDIEDDFGQILAEEGLEAADYGRRRTVNSVRQQGVSATFDQFSERVRDNIRNTAFRASQQTLNRMSGDVMGTIAKAYEEGLGIDDGAKLLGDHFDSMKDFELKRIARTETNSFQNEGAQQTMDELGIGYEQWWTAEDERVRQEDADHVRMHSQIIRRGGTFSNGLKYPGDRSGPIREWINCR